MCSDRGPVVWLVAAPTAIGALLACGSARGQTTPESIESTESVESAESVESVQPVESHSAGDATTEPQVAPDGRRGRRDKARAGRRRREGGAHTTIVGGIGLLALPGTEVCPSAFADCEPGETGISFALQSFVRFDDFELGAGIIYAAGLRATEVVGDADGSLGREHSRSYFLVEGHFHYYLPPLGSWQTWVGATVGGVVVNDSWTTKADRDPASDTDFVGPRAVTLGTEGLAVGLGVGGHWPFAEHFVFGTHFRYANWLLPSDREQTPVGDLASLAGRIDILDVGVTAGARLPL